MERAWNKGKNNKDKEDAMKKFWEAYDPNGYSIWKIVYDMPKTEGKVLFRTSNAKGFFLQKLDSFRKYCFAVHGVYGVDGDYSIQGVWMWRGTEIPQMFKENDYFDYLFEKMLLLENEKPEEFEKIVFVRNA